MSHVKAFVKKYWITAVPIVAICGGYWGITHAGLLDSVLFPTPERIWKAFMTYADTMPLNFTSSMAGVLMGMNKRVRDTIYPIVYAISVVPAILLSPFALHLAPSFTAASMFLIVYNTIWATLFATVTGIMTIDKRYLDNAATLCLSGPKKLVKVILPAAMPSILSGFVTSLRSSFLVLVFAEMYSAQYGMGYFVKKNADFGLYDNTWAGFLFMILVLVVVMQIFEKIKNHLLRWTMD